MVADERWAGRRKSYGLSSNNCSISNSTAASSISKSLCIGRSRKGYVIELDTIFTGCFRSIELCFEVGVEHDGASEVSGDENSSGGDEILEGTVGVAGNGLIILAVMRFFDGFDAEYGFYAVLLLVLCGFDSAYRLREAAFLVGAIGGEGGHKTSARAASATKTKRRTATSRAMIAVFMSIPRRSSLMPLKSFRFELS